MCNTCGNDPTTFVTRQTGTDRARHGGIVTRESSGSACSDRSSANDSNNEPPGERLYGHGKASHTGKQYSRIIDYSTSYCAAQHATARSAGRTAGFGFGAVNPIVVRVRRRRGRVSRREHSMLPFDSAFLGGRNFTVSSAPAAPQMRGSRRTEGRCRAAGRAASRGARPSRAHRRRRGQRLRHAAWGRMGEGPGSF